MEGITIAVCGVPNLLPVDRTVDKLTIHFLRPRNGGGEIVRVIYPTSTKGQAFVVFEQKEVAVKVSSKNQTLDIDGQQFPLEVAIIDGSEEDLPVQATLDLSKFLDQRSEVHRLLRKHNFKVTELGSGKVLLDGTFLGLRAVRSQLLKLLPQGSAVDHSTQHIRERSASASNGTTAHNGPLPRKSSTLPHANGGGGTHGCGNECYSSSSLSQRHFSLERSLSGYRSPPPSLDSSSSSSDQPLPLSSSSHQSRERVRSHRQQRNYLLQDSDAPQSLPILPSECLASKPPLQSRVLSPRAMSPRALSPMETSLREASSKEASFSVDSNGFSYTCSFKKDQVDSILMSHGVSVSTSHDSGVTILTLKGKDCEGAKTKLQELINYISLSLRVQEILLTQFSHDEKTQISKRIQRFKDVFKVLVRQEGSSVFIIGPSVDSYEMKQQVLGESVDPGGSTRVGRATDRGQRITRSSSLPKQPKVRPDQDHSTGAGYSYNGRSTTMPYSPSHYQDERRVGGAAVEAGTRRRTSSESRNKVMSQRSVPKATPQDLVPVPSSSRNAPQMKNFLSLNPAAAITNKIKNLTGKKSPKS